MYSMYIFSVHLFCAVAVVAALVFVFAALGQQDPRVVLWDAKIEKINESGIEMVMPVIWPWDTYQRHCKPGMRFHQFPPVTLKDQCEVQFKGQCVRGIAVEPEHGKVVGCLIPKEGSWTKSTHTNHLMSNVTEMTRGQTADVHKAANKRVGLNVAAFSVMDLDGEVQTGAGAVQMKRKKCQALVDEDSDDSGTNWLDAAVGPIAFRTEVGSKEEREAAGLKPAKQNSGGGVCSGGSAVGRRGGGGSHGGGNFSGMGNSLLSRPPGNSSQESGKSLKVLRAGNAQKLACKDVLAKLMAEFGEVCDDRFVGKLKIAGMTRLETQLEKCSAPNAIKLLREADGDSGIWWAVSLINQMQECEGALAWTSRLIACAAEGDLNKREGTAAFLKHILVSYSSLPVEIRNIVQPAAGYYELCVRREARRILNSAQKDDGDGGDAVDGKQVKDEDKTSPHFEAAGGIVALLQISDAT